MTFNDDARIDTSKVQRRGGAGRKTAMIGGGGALGVLVLFIASQLLGVDLTPLANTMGVDTGQSSSSGQPSGLENCETGADANADDECRMAAAADSIDRFWETQVNGYRSPQVVLYSDYTDSGCGTASAAIGPFYCPSDESIYMDTAFFSTLRNDYGASGGPLAQMYVLAHEWGHHISNLTGALSSVGRDTGPASGSVRLELQADCYAGAWVRDASKVTDSSGVPFLQPVSESEIADAMDAAATVGDDHIQQQAGQRVNPDSFSHGSSEQRQHWFQVGYQRGALSCDTFAVSANEL